MQRVVVIAACAVLGLAMLEAAPAAANEAQTKATDFSAQTAQRARRPRTTLTVRPRRFDVAPPRHFSTPYPLPYAVDYPGPNTVRQCAARYVEEHRPSGTVIVPRVRCWWERS
jgi:hypothetical protein